jgi:hypothetical protein
VGTPYRTNDVDTDQRWRTTQNTLRRLWIALLKCAGFLDAHIEDGQPVELRCAVEQRPARPAGPHPGVRTVPPGVPVGSGRAGGAMCAAGGMIT